MDFPSLEKTFYLDFTTEFGNRYEGTFTVKCLLNIGEKHRLELEKSRLLGSSTNPTDDLYSLSLVVAACRAKIISGPNWWTQSKGGELLVEEDLLGTVYAKVQDAEQEWKADLIKKATESKEQSPAPAPSKK